MHLRSSTGRNGRGTALAAAGIVLVGLLGLAGLLVLVLRDDGGESAGADTELPPLEEMVHLDGPAGWTRSEDGLAAAEDGDPLSGDGPVAPRVHYVPTEAVDDAAPPGPAIAEAMARATTLVAGPEEITVDGQPALTVTVTEDLPSGDSIMRMYVVVTTTDDRSALFVAEAPVEEFDGAADEMLDAIGTD